jgi:ferritin-like metal-binding protein YciE
MATSLELLFNDGLRDIYFAERKILNALPKMIEAAQSDELRSAFEKHRGETETHVTRLQEAFELLGKRPQAKTCAAIEGILAEGDELMQAYKATPALDAALIASAQAVEHYEMVRYGTLAQWAVTIGLPDVAELLETTLAEEAATDEALTELATASVNDDALATVH